MTTDGFSDSCATIGISLYFLLSFPFGVFFLQPLNILLLFSLSAFPVDSLSLKNLVNFSNSFLQSFDWKGRSFFFEVSIDFLK